MLRPVLAGAWLCLIAPIGLLAQDLAARGERLAAFGAPNAAAALGTPFGRRCIPAGCVAPPSNTPGILGRHALPAGRIVALGATPDVHHGLLPPGTQQSAPIVRSIVIAGAKEVAEQALLDAIGFQAGQPLADTPDQISETIRLHYRDEGYTFALVNSQFDAASGVLSVTIDEGVIDGVEFQGIDEPLMRKLHDEFALRARKLRYGVASLCIGGGMGIAMAIQNLEL